MKKILSGIVGSVVVAGGLFYYTSQKLVGDEINAQLTALQAHGFVIQDRKENADGEHLVISLADMHKFSKLIPEYEAILLAEDKSALKDFKLGVDWTSSGAGISMDIYPVSFPTADIPAEAKEIMDKYIADKTLMLHLDYNTLTKNFEGNLKDIDEEINNEIGLKLLGLAFDGSLSDEKIALNYKLNEFKLSDDKKSIVEATGVSSVGTYEGLNYYISNGTTNVDKVFINLPNTTDSLDLSNMSFKVTSDVKNKLLESRLNMVTKTLDASIRGDKFTLDNFTFDYGIKNIDMEAFDKLTKLINRENPNFQSPEVKGYIADMFKNGMEFDIYKLGVDSIMHNGQTLKGFSLKTNLKIDNNPDLIQTLQMQPMQALSSVTIDGQIKVSDEIFAEILKNPKGRMAMMIQAKEENGYKIYDIELKESKLKVNGRQMM